jgi:SAM-dependent methyltransferase
MKSNLKTISSLFLLPILVLRRLYFWVKTNKSILPGRKFAEYGFRIGRILLRKGRLSIKLLLNPVSIVRYFEFEYAEKHLKVIEQDKILDISSPYLFGFYQSSKQIMDYHYINPDRADLTNVISLSRKLKFKGNYSTMEIDALNLPFEDSFFSKIVSISVIEHIEDDGDVLALKEMWRVLKPNGVLILTFPVKKEYDIEYKDKDIYNLNIGKASGRYFFQRIYDEQKIRERLLSSIDNFKIIEKEIFGVTIKEFFNEYKKRWIKYSYWETVKDPFYVTKYFTYFSDIKDLEDIGIMGLTIKKL